MKRKHLKFWVGRFKKSMNFGYYPNEKLYNAAKDELKQLINERGNNVRSWDLIALNDAFRESHGLTRVSRNA